MEKAEPATAADAFTATTFEHNVATAEGSVQASALMGQLERTRAIKKTAVPTDDKLVRARLRALGEPITLFGEEKVDRRERLQRIVFERKQESQDGDVEIHSPPPEEKAEPQKEEWEPAPNPQALLDARRDMCRFSIPRAKKRVAYQKAESRIRITKHIPHRKAIKERAAAFEVYGSQQASDRPMARVRFSPNGELVAAGTWGGGLKLFKPPNLETKIELRGHNDIVGGVSWRPGVTFEDLGVVHLASGDGEGTIHLWSIDQPTPLSTLKGHEARIANLEFHPSGKYIGTASHDYTWRLWDIESSTELLAQEGHAAEVLSIAFQIDGSLVASGGKDSIGRIFDLRSGKIIMYLDSHIDAVHALDWSTDGHRILSGSADGMVKVWDLRAVSETATLGAHNNGIADLRWFKGTDGPLNVDLPAKDERGDWMPKKSGTLFVTGGFDHSAKIWSADDWAPIKTFNAHDRTVTGVDISNDMKYVVSCSLDKTVKLWARDDLQAV